MDCKNWLLTLGGSNHELTKILVVFIGHVYLLGISIFSHFYCVLWVFFVSNISESGTASSYQLREFLSFEVDQ